MRTAIGLVMLAVVGCGTEEMTSEAVRIDCASDDVCVSLYGDGYHCVSRTTSSGDSLVCRRNDCVYDGDCIAGHGPSWTCTWRQGLAGGQDSVCVGP
jgi:hypothetical protein